MWLTKISKSLRINRTDGRGGEMAGRIVLINPARHFIANEHGLGYLIPLGLVCIGGPLIDAGFTVKLIDHDLYGWSYPRLIKEISDFKADYILLGHSGSTACLLYTSPS